MFRVFVIITGVLLSLLGSIGLFVFGPSIAQLYLMLTWEPGPVTGQELNPYRMAGASAVLLALGATLMGLVAQRDSVRLSVMGKALVSLASLLVVLATLTILYGLYLEYQLGVLLSAPANTPTVQQARVGTEEATLPVRVGFGLLVLSQLLILGGAFCLRATDKRVRGSVTVQMAGITYMVSSWMVAAIFILIWFIDTRAVEDLLAGAGSTLTAAEMARHIRAILIKAVLICFLFFLQAGCLAAIGFSSVRE